jgi:peptidoglycan/LPS O-acetylase OafA/YrhL
MLSKRGVELFFVISGLVLGLPFARSHARISGPVSLKCYFLRRLTRLEPPYIVNMLLAAAGLIAVGKVPLPEVVPHLLASLAYVHNIVYRAPSTINGVAWSLEVEIQFYCFAPLLASIFALRRRVVRVVILGGLIVGWSLLTASLSPQPSLLYYGPFFLAGFVVAELYLFSKWTERSLFWDLTLFGWPIVWLIGRSAGQIVLPLLLVFLVYGAMQARIISRALSSRWCTNIGGMCYSIYLFHGLLISGVGRVTKPLHFGSSFTLYFLLQALLILPIVVLVCAAFFILVERPCMDKEWPRKLLSRIRRMYSSNMKTEPAL